ncbi:MAG: hypothetical protein MUF38_13560 [Anaerolineae bacterium]|nr:hypothetical protein [Anaerolineae bacterium]
MADNFVCAGYFLIREGMRNPRWSLPQPLASHVISLAPQICDKFASSWFWTSQSPDSACEFDPALCNFERYVNWCEQSPYTPHGTVFSSVVAAQVCARELELNPAGLWLIGVGYPAAHLNHYQRPLESGGRFIGFDLVYQWLDTEFDSSWLEFPNLEFIHNFENVNITPQGLFADLVSAQYLYERQPNQRGQIEHLDYWQLLSYPLG